MKAWLSLGGNVGDVQTAMASALRAMDADSATIVRKVSPVYRTPPWGPVDQDWFLNCCAELETGHEPKALLDLCQRQEREAQRLRIVRWGPRTLDIDIIAIEGRTVAEPGLEVPHPRAQERAFVTVPLADIAPDVDLGGRTAGALAQGERIERLPLAGNWWALPS